MLWYSWFFFYNSLIFVFKSFLFLNSTCGYWSITGEVNSEKLSLMKVAAVIEKSANTGAVVLDLRGFLCQLGNYCSLLNWTCLKTESWHFHPPLMASKP